MTERDRLVRRQNDAERHCPVGRGNLEGFGERTLADAPPRRGQARGLTADECATVLATCLRPRRTGRGRERPKTAERRGLVDGATSVTAATARPRSVTCTPRPHRNRVIRWPASALTGSTVRAGRASASEPHAAKWRRQSPAPAVLVTSSNTTSTTAEPVDSAQE